MHRSKTLESLVYGIMGISEQQRTKLHSENEYNHLVATFSAFSVNNLILKLFQ